MLIKDILKIQSIIDKRAVPSDILEFLDQTHFSKSKDVISSRLIMFSDMISPTSNRFLFFLEFLYHSFVIFSVGFITYFYST